MTYKLKPRWPIVVGCLGLITILWSGGMSARTRTIGMDRLVSVQPLTNSSPEMCPWPTSATMRTAQVTEQDARSGSWITSHMPRVLSRVGNIDKAPLRFIRDPNPTWSSIAVNAENNMVIMTDENLFRVVEYSRLDNTPPDGPPTMPRRVIGGYNTLFERSSAVYVDPKTLEVYVNNSDTLNWMPVFSREAKGNAIPDRFVSMPHRPWAFAADETRQELYLTIQSPSAVIVYRKAASGTEAPLRLLEGDATQLADPHGLALDMKNDLIVVANHGHRRFYGGPAVSTLTRTWEEWAARAEETSFGVKVLPRRYLPGLATFEQASINIYARGASGNTAPLRVIKGPKTQLNWPSHVAVHEERGEIFVANDADNSVLVFRETDSGDVAPIRVIKGSRTKVMHPAGLALDVKNNELWVASMGNFTATVFPLTANGDVTPIRNIRGGPANETALMIGNPGAVAYDSKRQEILVPN